MTRLVSLSLLGLAAVGILTALVRAPHPERRDVAHAQGTPTAAVSGGADAALALWKRTLRAQEQTPLQARAEVLISTAGAGAEEQTIDVFEAMGGKYRLVYRAPKSVAGRIVVCDGSRVYHYEPSRATAIQRPRPPFRDPVMGFSDDVLAARFAVVLPETPRIEGRPTRVLEIRARNGGGLREKRWVDVQTGRSLRMEQFAVSGKKIRQVELRRIVLPYTAASDLFKPRFPPKVRVIAASAERSPDAERAAARLQLPTRFGDFQVRSVVRPRTTGEATHQVLYSDGIYALSVFVSPENGSARPHGDDWDEVTLSPSVIGYSHDADEQGRSAIAWLRGGHRYVAVGRLPLPLLLRTTRELVTTAVSRASRAQGK